MNKTMYSLALLRRTQVRIYPPSFCLRTLLSDSKQPQNIETSDTKTPDTKHTHTHTTASSVEKDDAIARYEKATQSLSKEKIGGVKYLTNEEKLKIAAIDLVSEKETQIMQKQVLKNKIYGFGGLFVSLMGLTAGITLFLI
jgi:hypothetical protein